MQLLNVHEQIRFLEAICHMLVLWACKPFIAKAMHATAECLPALLLYEWCSSLLPCQLYP